MNLTQEPFTDKKVREAFSYAIDRETLCAEIRSGDCIADALLDPARASLARSKPTSTRFDPEAAVQALAESSYGGPENLPEIKLYLQQRHFRSSRSRSEWIAGEIRDILGVELTHRAD